MIYYLIWLIWHLQCMTHSMYPIQMYNLHSFLQLLLRKNWFGHRLLHRLLLPGLLLCGSIIRYLECLQAQRLELYILQAV